MKKKHWRNLSLERKRAIAGWLFVMPWVIGFAGLFMRSLVSSLLYSFYNVSIKVGGLQMADFGLHNYIRAFVKDTFYIRNLTSEVGSMLYEVPITLAFSLFMGVMIHDKFRGRTFVRAVLFLPVICGSGLIMSLINGDSMSSSILSGARTSMMFQTRGIDFYLLEMGMSENLVSSMMSIVNGIFDLAWKSGLQIILFLSGILTISPSLYESAKIEGATSWEMFWKITFPMLTPMLLLNTVYSIIDCFTDYQNSVVRYIYDQAKLLDFGYSSALSWMYFLIIILIIGVVYKLINKRVVYVVE